MYNFIHLGQHYRNRKQISGCVGLEEGADYKGVAWKVLGVVQCFYILVV